MNLPGRLKQIRDERGLNQREAAALAEVSGAQWSRYEAGTAKPSAEVLQRMAERLGVAESWLLGRGPRALGPLAVVEPELASFEWPEDTPEAVRIAVQQQVLAEREAHRKALVPYWHERMRALLARERNRQR